MARVGVFHPRFGQGGAEAVCMNTLQALQRDHDTALITLSSVDFEEQNDFFQTDVDPDTPVFDARTVDLLNASRALCKRTLGTDLARFHSALLTRTVRARHAEFDAVVSTHGGLTVPGTSVQYVHYPLYGRADLPGELAPESRLRRLYDRVNGAAAGHDPTVVAGKRLLTNSEWTADVVASVYGTTPEVVHPPVVTDDLWGADWADRESGFVTVSRLRPNKNHVRNMEIVGDLRGRGHDAHLHVVGPSPDPEYREVVEREAADREYVHFEGKVSRERIVELLATHRYGLHGMRNEHFGIAIAEMRAAGMLPFVPDGGGQCEIVDRRPELLYDGRTEAVERADRVLSDPDLQRRLRRELSDADERFAPERFRSAIRRIVEEELRPAGDGRRSSVDVRSETESGTDADDATGADSGSGAESEV